MTDNLFMVNHEMNNDSPILHVTPQADGRLYCYAQHADATQDYSYVEVDWTGFLAHVDYLSDFVLMIHTA